MNILRCIDPLHINLQILSLFLSLAGDLLSIVNHFSLRCSSSNKKFSSVDNSLSVKSISFTQNKIHTYKYIFFVLSLFCFRVQFFFFYYSLSSLLVCIFNVSLQQQLKKKLYHVLYICIDVTGSFYLYSILIVFFFFLFAFFLFFRSVHSCASLTVQTAERGKEMRTCVRARKFFLFFPMS